MKQQPCDSPATHLPHPWTDTEGPSGARRQVTRWCPGHDAVRGSSGWHLQREAADHSGIQR